MKNLAAFDSNNSSDIIRAESVAKKYNLLASQHMKNKHYYAGLDISKINHKAFRKLQRKSTSLLKPATPITDYNKNKLKCFYKHNWSYKDPIKDNTESDTESYINASKSRGFYDNLYTYYSDEDFNISKSKGSRNLSAKPNLRL